MRIGFAAAAGAALGLLVNAVPVHAQPSKPKEHRTRPRIVIHPQRWIVEPGPSAKRYCRSWLVQEYRVSGTVVVPKMQCRWQ